MSPPDGAIARRAVPKAQPGLSEKPHLVSLRGPLVVAHADSIRRDLLRAIERHDTVLIDCAQATDADLSLVQLLIAADRTAAAAGKSIRLDRVSPVVTAAFAAGGFSMGVLSGL